MGGPSTTENDHRLGLFLGYGKTVIKGQAPGHEHGVFDRIEGPVEQGGQRQFFRPSRFKETRARLIVDEFLASGLDMHGRGLVYVGQEVVTRFDGSVVHYFGVHRRVGGVDRRVRRCGRPGDGRVFKLLGRVPFQQADFAGGVKGRRRLG